MTTTSETQRSTTQPGHDPRPALRAAMDQVETLLHGITAEQAHLPTPCDEYDVARLVDHLQAVVRRIGVVLSGEPFWSVPREVESTDWLVDWAAGRAATEAVLGAEENLRREVTVPWGVVPAAGAAASYIGELTVHAWDLASATGQTGLLDPTLAQAALPAYQDKVPAQPRGGDIPFGPVVPVAPEAGPYETLVAWTGRDPGWPA
ncbi:MAG: TIGR03086 family metal-binding protein [Intrasporangium sp.]|uniref:TIGR03086 family metal-binding protein n=1 Tax=Intrasporangium sp. TaxID=1925024 RepID=UPI0026496A86|nr:TIGR03086 family metal-binding protein [Intrasporangium sp.]MDN5796483.1 TIGR03086 family metal-binding protein [Intrasporangium sp.]